MLQNKHVPVDACGYQATSRLHTPRPPQPPTPPTPPPAPGPPPKFSCDMATAEECDASPCCNWCSSTWNTSSSFCMPVLNEAVPMATCSKDEGPCDVKSESACSVSDTCSWITFVGEDPNVLEGVCVTDWQKCWSPIVLDKHAQASLAQTKQSAGPWSSKHRAKAHLTKKHLALVKQYEEAAAAMDPKPNGTCTSLCGAKYFVSSTLPTE